MLPLVGDFFTKNIEKDTFQFNTDWLVKTFLFINCKYTILTFTYFPYDDSNHYKQYSKPTGYNDQNDVGLNCKVHKWNNETWHYYEPELSMLAGFEKLYWPAFGHSWAARADLIVVVAVVDSVVFLVVCDLVEVIVVVELNVVVFVGDLIVVTVVFDVVILIVPRDIALVLITIDVVVFFVIRDSTTVVVVVTDLVKVVVMGDLVLVVVIVALLLMTVVEGDVVTTAVVGAWVVVALDIDPSDLGFAVVVDDAVVLVLAESFSKDVKNTRKIKYLIFSFTI